MKNLFIVSYFICCWTILTVAQDSEKNSKRGKIGITYTPEGLFNSVTLMLDDTPNEDSKFFSVEANCLYSFNKTLDFETGIDFSQYHIVSIPGTSKVPSDTFDFSLITIPLTLRVNFLKYCFINGGILVDIDLNNFLFTDRNIGFGTNLGMGLNFKLKFGLQVFGNLYIKTHSISLLESGFRFGAMYPLFSIKRLQKQDKY